METIKFLSHTANAAQVLLILVSNGIVVDVKSDKDDMSVVESRKALEELAQRQISKGALTKGGWEETKLSFADSGIGMPIGAYLEKLSGWEL